MSIRWICPVHDARCWGNSVGMAPREPHKKADFARPLFPECSPVLPHGQGVTYVGETISRHANHPRFGLGDMWSLILFGIFRLIIGKGV